LKGKSPSFVLQKSKQGTKRQKTTTTSIRISNRNTLQYLVKEGATLNERRRKSLKTFLQQKEWMERKMEAVDGIPGY